MILDLKFKVLHQGSVELPWGEGYMPAGCNDAVCFYIDVAERAYVEASSCSDTDCPVLYLNAGEKREPTSIEFTGLPGWKFHSGGGGKTLAIALTRHSK